MLGCVNIISGEVIAVRKGISNPILTISKNAAKNIKSIKKMKLIFRLNGTAFLNFESNKKVKNSFLGFTLSF